jgi:hypothetical protein
MIKSSLHPPAVATCRDSRQNALPIGHQYQAAVESTLPGCMVQRNGCCLARMGSCGCADRFRPCRSPLLPKFPQFFAPSVVGKGQCSSVSTLVPGYPNVLVVFDRVLDDAFLHNTAPKSSCYRTNCSRIHLIIDAHPDLKAMSDVKDADINMERSCCPSYRAFATFDCQAAFLPAGK